MFRDRIASIVLLAFCAFFYYESFGISNKNLTGMEATFFPRVLLGSIAILAIILLIRSFFIKQPAAEKAGPTEATEKKKNQWWTVWLIFALFAVYVVVIDILGFTFSSFLFMAIVYLIAVKIPVKSNLKRHALSISFLLVISIALTFIFENFLQVYLPKGIFF